MIACSEKIQRAQRRSRFALPLAVVLGTVAVACGEYAERRSAPGHALALAAAPEQGWFRRQTLLLEPLPDAFGRVIAMSGDTAIIGTPDSAIFAYSLVDGVWSEPRELTIEGTLETIEPEYVLSVAVSGNTAVIGAPNTTVVGPRGAAYVFSRTGSTWERVARLQVDDVNEFGHFGAAVAIDDDILVVGAPMGETAYVFARVGDRWLQQKQLIAGDNPPTPGYRNRYGEAVAISGRTVVVGAPKAGDPDPFGNAGKAYAYAMPSDLSSTWPETVLLPDLRHSGELFGRRLAASENTIFVGAPREARSVEGAVYAFTKRGAGYGRPQKLTSGSDYFGDLFGQSLALSGERAVIGAPGLQSGPRLFPGGAYVYARNETGWILDQALIPQGSGEAFGSAVGIANDSLIIGAPALAPGGAAYVYRRSGEPGSACVTDAECGLGHCVADVCCDRPCDGPCEECSTGDCLPVPSGGPGAPACEAYLCDGTHGSCPTSCVANGDCALEHYCDEGECRSKSREGAACVSPEECLSGNCVRRRCSGTLDNGMPCEDASDCVRGYCVDGVCCNDSCGQQCEACDEPGREGECVPVTEAPHGDREPCAGAGTPCAGRCDGTLTAACTYPAASKECDRSCESETETVSACDGQGRCVAGEPRSCGRFTCGEIACETSCEGDEDCADGLVCWADGECDAPARCASDDESETAPGGSREDCWPYLCATTNGACKTRCVSAISDCAAPNVCDPNGRCVSPPVEDSGGCGCRTDSRVRNSWPVSAALVVLAFLRRRLRAPQPKRDERRGAS
ncbi:MAG TPA: FG-GAP repeat protein [Polyangiaceae bacterium]